MKIEEIIREKKGTILDVRTHEEFQGGHVADSKNIPLNMIMDKVDEIKNFEKPLILVCASGNRSGQAHRYLSSIGIDCVNAGSWMDVNYYQSLTV
ncbi:MAG: rhodanese-like domain-containing protein [Saprospiraceae bacterium]|nr:rhodanese-like domain-containing protein [Saprospiraceae bacterium]